ncbi:glycosyl hydrolase 115 family protein [uncultured Bacteroides sp.]|jgi:hypothetical protein|uniref:glycosyl hydrolase 115 family protein n=1 Tax=uncultured Bacteroides sp. TaxID=162156 RepID=UPI002583603C|nr:glycosyl hydrolase 115 family protein [uncultured Bacteroides sp.]
MMENKRRKTICLIILLWGISLKANSVGDKFTIGIPSYVEQVKTKDAFRIVDNGMATTICVDPSDWKGVVRAANDLGDDIRKVSGVAAGVMETASPSSSSIWVGTIGKSKLIDKLIAEKKIDVSEIQGQWESFQIQTVDGNLVVVGSDKRGTIYGIYDISEKIGVSPWYWWADVPVKKNKCLYVKAGKYVQSSPKVKYRGIFINDEEPSFGQWTRKKFGGFNSKMYRHMFELLLRLKANFLWPAMWSSAFNEDDPMNPVIADEYGIVMSTSHHEPMMRAHQEYTRRRKEVGPWDYVMNKEGVERFFREGLERNKNYENLITIGMRGDGDAAMGKGSDEENMETLQAVIKGQREIVRDVYGKEPSEVPQVWAIFTEVQRYYDKGFSVPDDVLLLFCDNNWGYIRRIGPEKEKRKKRKMGLYYHIDMNGGPCNDRWINTTTIPKLREQFNLAYQTGLDDLWVMNVGDLKPKELPIDFVMRYAWNPDAIPADKVWDYTAHWAAGIFGEEYAEEIADIVSKYSKYNLWRKPEVQATTIFSVVNHCEADRVIQLWRDVTAKAEALQGRIAPEARDAYYQLVLYPVKASAGVAEIYLQASKNNLYARQGRVSANDCAERARELFKIDKKLSDYYNDSLAQGKWKNMMQDVHLGYVGWMMPKENSLPELKEVIPLKTPMMGVAVEGSFKSWPANASMPAQLPIFDVLTNQSYYIDIFNRGIGTFQFEVRSDKSWIRLSEQQGEVAKEKRIMVSVDWEQVPQGETEAIVEIRQGHTMVPVKVKAVKTAVPETNDVYFGSLTGGEFSIPADKYEMNVAGKDAQWIVLPDLGRGDACMGIYPVTASSTEKYYDAPRLEYKLFVPKAGKMTVCLGILPTQDVYPERGLRMAVGIDNDTPKRIDARKGFWDEFHEYTPQNLERTKTLKPLPSQNRSIRLIGTGRTRRNEVFDNLRWIDVDMDVTIPGMHTLKVFMVDPEVVLERIVVNPDNNYPSYFGIPSVCHNVKQ